MPDGSKEENTQGPKWSQEMLRVSVLCRFLSNFLFFSQNSDNNSLILQIRAVPRSPGFMCHTSLSYLSIFLNTSPYFLIFKNLNLPVFFLQFENFLKL